MMGSPCFDLQTLVQSGAVTCDTAEYITNVKEEQAFSRAVGNKIKTYKTTSIINHPDTGVIHHINVLSSKVTVIVTGWCWSAL